MPSAVGHKIRLDTGGCVGLIITRTVQNTGDTHTALVIILVS